MMDYSIEIRHGVNNQNVLRLPLWQDTDLGCTFNQTIKHQKT